MHSDKLPMTIRTFVNSFMGFYMALRISRKLRHTSRQLWEDLSFFDGVMHRKHCFCSGQKKDRALVYPFDAHFV